MTASPDLPPSIARLNRALVLRSTEDLCTVFLGGRRAEFPYAAAFPRPRAERTAPGHLVAIATTADGVDVVVWRWFDAVILDVGEQVRLWEPAHGDVLARPRDPLQHYVPGSRAYVSAGLEGADWWVAGGAVTRAEDAQVELDEVERFLIGHGLLDER